MKKTAGYDGPQLLKVTKKLIEGHTSNSIYKDLKRRMEPSVHNEATPPTRSAPPSTKRDN
jgi:hypothetical protein